MKHIFSSFIFIFPLYLCGQIKDLNFTASIDFLKLPEGWNLLEVAGVAVNSRSKTDPESAGT